MVIGIRFRKLRRVKKLSPGDIAKRCGLARSYICHVEKGHTVPTVVTLERLSDALEMPLWKFFYEGGKLPRALVPNRGAHPGKTTEIPAADRKFLKKLSRMWTRMKKRNQELLLLSAEKMSSRKRRRRRANGRRQVEVSELRVRL